MGIVTKQSLPPAVQSSCGVRESGRTGSFDSVRAATAANDDMRYQDRFLIHSAAVPLLAIVLAIRLRPAEALANERSSALWGE